MSARVAAGWNLSSPHVGVGRAQKPVPAPGDDEEDARRRAQDDACVQLHPVARDDEVDALRGAHAELAALADEPLDVVGPHAGRVHDLAGGDVQLLAAAHVAHADAGGAARLAQQPDHLGVGDDRRAVVRRGPRDLHRVPRVVELGVPVLDRADERAALEAGRQPERLRGASGGDGAAGPCSRRARRRAASPRRRRRAPARAGSAGRGTTPAARGAAPDR